MGLVVRLGDLNIAEIGYFFITIDLSDLFLP